MTCPNCGTKMQHWPMLRDYFCPWCGTDIAEPLVVAPEHQEVAQMHRKFEAIVNREWADSPTRWGKK